MPVHWETATREPSTTPNDDVAWVTQSVRLWDTTRRGTLVALCDGLRVDDTAYLTALSELEDFYYFPPSEQDDPAETLADAITQAQFITKYYPANGSSKAGHSEELAIIAAVIHHGTLYVVQSGRFRACVWRKGELIQLAIDPPASTAPGHAQYKLDRKDRVLLCSEEIYQQVATTRIAAILGTEQGTDHTINRVLDEIATTQPVTAQTPSPISVAVLDYEPLFSGATLAKAAIACISALVLLALSLWLAGRFLSTQDVPALVPAFASSTPAPVPPTTQPLTPTMALVLAPTTIEPPIQTQAQTQTLAPVSTSTTSPTSLIPSATPNRVNPLVQNAAGTQTATSPPTSPPMTPTAVETAALPQPTVTPGSTSIPPTFTPTPISSEPLTDSVRALNPQRVTLGKESIPITLTTYVSSTAPAAYVLPMQQGQTLNVQVTHTAAVKVLNAQGLALAFRDDSVRLLIGQTGDYVIVVSGNSAVTVNINVSPP